MADFGDPRVIERIWQKVVVLPNGCWAWTSSIDRYGYGEIWYQRGKRMAHKTVYVILVGDVVDGHQLDHLCHTADETCPGGRTCPHRRCVNPAHLEPVPSRENTMRGNSFAAKNAAKTHCKWGHELAGDNVRIYHYPGNTGRHCVACIRERGSRVMAER